MSETGETPIDLGKTSFRVKTLEFSRVDIKKPEVLGRENLPQVPCVVATTHLSDIDVQEVALEVARDRKIGIVSQKTNLTEPLFRPFVAAIGRDNFFPIQNNIKAEHAYKFRLEDVDQMKKGIVDQGRTMVVAAHNPVTDWKLPDQPGLGAVVLAHSAGVLLVPVALDIKSETAVGMSKGYKTRIGNFVTMRRPDAQMIIGEPLPLSEIPKEKLEQALSLYSLDKRRGMSEEEVVEAKETLEVLQREAGDMMKSLASKLPAAKRGKWDQGKDLNVQS